MKLALPLLSFCSASLAAGQCPSATLNALPGGSEHLERTLALEEDLAAVGLGPWSGNPSQPKRVVVYRRTLDGTWRVEDKLDHAGRFGAALAWNGDRLFASAPGDGTDAPGPLRVLAWDPLDLRWKVQQHLVATHGEDDFALRIATQGDVLATLSIDQVDVEHLSIYERDDHGLWQERAHWVDADLGLDRLQDVAVSDGRVVVSDNGTNTLTVFESVG